jgi:hypothetical protein
MALHAAAMMAFFVDQMAQAPVVVNCPALAPESPWKWIIQSVAPVAGGTLIAVWSFVANRKSEQRQWVRDQKKAEWRELFGAFTEVKKKYLPIYENEQTAKAFTENWNEMEQTIDSIAMPFVFVAQKLIDIEFYDALQDFKDKASKDRDSLQELIKSQLTRLIEGTERNQIQETYLDVENEYMRIVLEMRRFAEEDLDIKTPAKPLWRRTSSRIYAWIKHPFGGSHDTRQDPPPIAGE